MYMTTSKLITLRLFNITLGRFSFFGKLLRKFLILILIKKNKNNKYGATSNFFDYSEIER